MNAPAPHFSRELLAEVTTKLQAYATSHRGAREREALEELMARLCTYAHSVGMSPEGLVIALREAYTRVVALRVRDEHTLRAIYDELLAGCLAAYFAEQKRATS